MPKQKKKINYKTKKRTSVKFSVTEQQEAYCVNISSNDSTLPLDSIICGDALKVLQSFPDCFVDLIITSPPYADKRTNSYDGIHPFNRWSQH